jgi:hypothetical protein
MANSNAPARVPERQPEPTETGNSRPAYPRPAQNPRVPIRIFGAIPT